MLVSSAHSQQEVIRPSMVIDFPSGGPNFRFYNKIDENDTMNRWRYTIVWNSIVEYSDTNQNGIFDNGIDTVVRNVSIQDINFSFNKLQANLTGLSNQLVTGKELQFQGNTTLDSTLSYIKITIGWWNDAVLHPYGSKFIKVGVSQSKYSIELDNWNFKSMNNRLAVLTFIKTTTSLDSYNITDYKNGTISMITKTNPDGKGNRGGIINNPNVTLIDNDIFKPMNLSNQVMNDQINLQYSFPSFNKSLLYDPTYASVATIPASNQQSTSQNNTPGIKGFGFLYIFMTIPIIILIKKKKILK